MSHCQIPKSSKSFTRELYSVLEVSQPPCPRHTTINLPWTFMPQGLCICQGFLYPAESCSGSSSSLPFVTVVHFIHYAKLNSGHICSELNGDTMNVNRGFLLSAYSTQGQRLKLDCTQTDHPRFPPATQTRFLLIANLHSSHCNFEKPSPG